MKERTITKPTSLLQRVQAIIDELNIVLTWMPGKLPLTLRSLYDFIYTKLVEANIKKDTILIDQMVNLLTELRSSWAELQNAQKKVVSAGE